MHNSKFELIWTYVYPIFEFQKSPLGGKPMLHKPKDILAGIYWILDTGAQWRCLPKDFPPRSTCHYWLKKWSQDGTFETMYQLLIELAVEDGAIDLSDAFVDATFVRSKGGHDEVGNTKCGKGSKMMAIVDKNGLPVSISIHSASPHEATLVEEALDMIATDHRPKNLVGDKAYDSDPLDQILKKQGINMIAPHKKNRVKEKTQCSEELQEKYKKRHFIENFFAIFQWARRVVVRYEKKVSNFTGFALFQTTVCLIQKLGLLRKKQREVIG
jgi:transposase